MEHIYGMLDALESIVLDGKKVPFSDKILLDEKQLLSLIDKIRLSIKSEAEVIKNSLSRNAKAIEKEAPVSKIETPQISTEESILENAYKEAGSIRKGADEYADFVLANLQLMVTKMQSNIVKMEKNMTGGRKSLEEKRDQKQIH